MARKVNVTLPNLSDLQFQIKLDGDWVRVGQLIDNLAPDIQKAYDTATSKFARALLRIVKTSIATGSPPKGSGVYWEPLSDATLRKYGDHPTYYLTGLYHRSVGLFKYKSRTLIGLPIGKKRSSQGGLTLNQLALILEYGTGGKGGGKSRGTIPPRPLWGPSLKSIGGKEKLRATILTELRRRFSRYGIKPNQVKW